MVVTTWIRNQISKLAHNLAKPKFGDIIIKLIETTLFEAFYSECLNVAIKISTDAAKYPNTIRIKFSRDSNFSEYTYLISVYQKMNLYPNFINNEMTKLISTCESNFEIFRYFTIFDMLKKLDAYRLNDLRSNNVKMRFSTLVINHIITLVPMFSKTKMDLDVVNRHIYAVLDYTGSTSYNVEEFTSFKAQFTDIVNRAKASHIVESIIEILTTEVMHRQLNFNKLYAKLIN